jgi:PAS domain S-box-containing protein
MDKPDRTKEPRFQRVRTLPATPSKRQKAASRAPRLKLYKPPPELQLIYDTAPVGLAFLSPDCRYVQINQRLTEICGISVADHIGRSVRECVPQVADQVEALVQAVMGTGEPVLGIEVRGQRPDKSNADHVWITNWHPLKGPDGSIVGVNVVAEEITERKRAEAILAASEKALRESERRFRELADNISQFAWTADETGWIYWYNRRWHDYTGTTLEEMQGWGWQKVHHPEHVDRVVARIRQSFESGAPWEDTFPLRGRDGSYRWFLSRALPIRNETGDIIRWFGTNTDVTEQIEAEKALRELNETLRQRVEAETQERLHIWNVSQDLLVVADLEGKYLSVNPAWTAVLGWSESDLLGKTSAWLLHPDDWEKTRAEIRHLAAGGKTVHFESRLRHKDGSYRWLSWKAAPDRGRIYGMGRDVTELKEAETQLRQTRRELAQVSRRTTLAATTASIAHEINQPLAAIVANGNAGLRWLASAAPDIDEVRAALKRIVADGYRTSDIIASIRGMFRKDGQPGTPLSVNALVRDVLALAQGELESHRIVLQTELREDLPQIVGDRVPLQQVLLNLTMNAVEAMNALTDRGRLLSVKTQTRDENDVLITVTDCGTGIDPKHMNRIFEAFFTTKPQGMGMGLSICRSIVEAHGGQLWAAPGRPHGSIFHVRLPAAAEQ